MKMNFSIVKSSSIYETFSPLYKGLKLFGIIPFKISLKKGKVTVSWLDVVSMLVFWIFWFYLIACNLAKGARDVSESSTIILYGWHWLLIFEIAASFFIQIVNLVKRKSIGRLLRILDEVDSMVSEKWTRNAFTNEFIVELDDVLSWKPHGVQRPNVENYFWKSIDSFVDLSLLTICAESEARELQVWFIRKCRICLHHFGLRSNISSIHFHHVEH